MPYIKLKDSSIGFNNLNILLPISFKVLNSSFPSQLFENNANQKS